MDTSSFTMPIEVHANNVATITLTYQEVLRRRKGVYDIRVIVGHCGNGYNTHVRLSVTETKPLTKLKVVPYWERPIQGNYIVTMMQTLSFDIKSTKRRIISLFLARATHLTQVNCDI